MNKLYILCGKSASGKDTILKEIQKEFSMLPVISTTTRPMRPNEHEGVEYFFISTDTFLNMEANNEFIETRTYNTIENGLPSVWYYGISKQAIDLSKGDHIVIVDLNGLEELKKEFKEEVVSIYIFIDDEERERRAMNRQGFEKAEWDRRLIDDNKQFASDRIKRDVDFIVHNTDLQEAVKNVKNIILRTGSKR